MFFLYIESGLTKVFMRGEVSWSTVLKQNNARFEKDLNEL